MPNLSDFIGMYLDEELDDSSFDQLHTLLRDDDAAIDELIVSSIYHSQLIEIMTRRGVQMSMAVKSIADDKTEYETEVRPIEKAAANASFMQAEPSTHDAPLSTNSGRYRYGLQLVMAATLAAIILSIANWYLSAPAIVARLDKAVGCRWQSPGGNLTTGTKLRVGQEVKLIKGRALVTFSSGAQIAIEGPAQMQLISAGSATLLSGRITAKVPTTAIGFTVTSPFARFTDLGTEFSLRVDADKGFELNVFDGLIEVHFVDHGDRSIGGSLRITEISALRYNAETGKLKRGVCDEREHISL